MNLPRVVEVTNLPACDADGSQARLLSAGGVLVVVYETQTLGWAVVRFDGCRVYLDGGLNDEAMWNHPLRGLGLKHYTIQEIVDSPWIEERMTLSHNRRTPQRPFGVRHFVLALKEDTVDVLAESCASVGVFDSLEGAMGVGFGIVSGRA